MARYDKDKVIGSGKFGNVWLVKTKLSRQSYVLKEIGLNALSKSDQQQALTEVSILSKCNNKHIIKYKEALLDQDNQKLCIYMEYAEGGDLYTAIAKQGGVPFPEHRVITWFVEICLALQYIHYLNILHRDLKSQNIFLTRSKTIKVGDFGISRVLKGPEEMAKTAIGTPYYLSPEIIQRKLYNYKSDIWALGCVLFEMAALEHAFQAQDFFHLMTLILSGKRRELPRHCGAMVQDLVRKLLNVVPDKRPSTGEILKYPSLQNYLSEYMTTENLQDHNSVTNERPPDNVSSDLRDNSVKRRASISAQNPKSTKQQTCPPLDTPGPSRSRGISNVHTSAVKKSGRSTPLGNATNFRQKRHFTRKLPTSKLPPRPVKPEKSNLTVSYDTYAQSVTTSCKNFHLTRSDNGLLDDGLDFGYQTEETHTQSSASNSDSLDCKQESLTKFKHFEESKVLNTDNVFSDVRTDYLDSINRFRQLSSPSAHNHCQHSQCHQCVLDMLWRNRIRCRVGASVDIEEYSGLKNKLLLVYKKDLFKKVYESLIYDWEGCDITASKETFQGIINCLTFEQVQSLPLMMQLIQLDLLMNSRE